MPIPFEDDLDTFLDLDAHGSWQKFRISNDKGGFIEFEAVCVVDYEGAKDRPTIRAYDVVVAHCLIYIREREFPRNPQAGELIYWNEGRRDPDSGESAPPNQVYTILEVTREECMLVLSLDVPKAGLFAHSVS